MTVVRHRRSYRPLTMLGLMAVVLVSLSPLLRSPASAQIDNQQPAQAFASVVDCIRAGADLGQPSHVSPRLVTTCYGSRWSGGGYTAAGSLEAGDSLPTDPSVVSFGDGQPNVAGSEPSHVPTANLGQVGSVYGVAYATGTNPAAPAGAAQQKRTFVGAYTKRLTRYGALGPGGIYVINNSTGVVSGYVTVPNVVPGPMGAAYNAGDGSRALFPNNPGNNRAYTPEMGGLHVENSEINYVPQYVGRTSLGDIDLDAEERYLYAVNLLTRRIVRFDTWSANPQATYTELPPMTLLSNPSSCNTGGASGPQDLQPFGLKVTREGVYVGFTCTARSSQNRNDLAAGVVRYTFSTGTWSNNLWSNGGAGWGLTAFDTQRGSWNGMSEVWQPWREGNVGGNEYDPQAMLATIDFTMSGNMILGFRDRFGDMGHSGRYVMEVQAMAAGDTLVAILNTTTNTWDVPDAGAERFDDETDFVHNEATWGGMTYIPGRHDGGWGGELVTTVVHPYRNNSAGAAWFDTGGGRPTAREELYLSASGTQSFSKAAGLGDLELECAWRAIGNRVWRDANGNGVQDSGEGSISGVRLQLADMSDNVLATVTTGSLDNADDNFRFLVNPFAQYKIKIDPAMFTAGQPLAGLHVSLHDQGGNDATDNDMTMWNNTIIVPAGMKGDVNLSYDIGVTDQPRIGDRVWQDGNGNGVQDAGEPGMDGVVVEILNSSAQVIDRSTTALGGYYGFTIAPNTAYTVRLPSSNFVAGAPLANMILAPRDRGGNDSLDSDADQIRRTVAVPGQPAGAMNFTFDIGVMATTLANGSVGDLVWNDNGNGVQDSGEPGIPGVTARLIDTANGSVAATTTTSLNGAYAFNNVIPGVYQVEFTSPTGATAAPRDAGGNDATDSDTDATSSWRTPPFEVIQDTTITTFDQGFVLPANVGLAKTGPGTAAAGSTVTYTLTYSNAGPGFAQNVAVADALPTGLTFVSATPAPTSVSGQAITWNLGTLAPNATGSISLVAEIAADAPTTMLNTATITTDSNDPDPGNNADTDDPGTTVTRPNVGIEKTGPATANVGVQVRYTLAYGNTGTGAATAAVVTDSLPVGTTFVSAMPAPSSQSGQTLTWNLGVLPPNATGSITVVAQISDTTTGSSIVNQSAITTTAMGDPDSANDTSNATTTLTRPNLSLSKDGPATAAAGSEFVYTLAYVNTGDGAAAGVSVTDTLPASLTFVSAQPAPTSQSGQTLTWDVGDVAAGGSGSVSLRVRLVATAQPGSAITNTAQTTTTSTGETTTTDNTGTATTTVSQNPNVTLTKTGPATANAGAQLTYTLDYGNSGGADAADVTVSDTLPAGLTFVSAAPAPSSVRGQVLTWNLNTVAAGATGRITVVTQLTTAAASGTTITNTASMTTTTANDPPADNTGTATTTVTTPTAIQLSYFKAERQPNGDVLVRWGTQSEQDTKEFKILRGTSNDRSQATLVGTVASKGSQGSDYTLTDADAPASGVLRYWLIEVENGGAETPYGPASAGSYRIFLPFTIRS